MLVSPLMVYAVCAAVAIWQLGWMRYLWWLAPLIWSITWLVSKIWKADSTPELSPIEANHWTPRDRKAAEIVRNFQQEAEFFNSDQLSDPRFYFNQALRIANDLARHYHPETTDPISHRTVAEILAACRLVADDLEKIVLTSVPGSRLLTVQQWKKLGDTPKVVRQLSKGLWATSILLNPFSLASWGTSKVTNEKVTSDLQTELLITFYMRFVRQLGYYLIEMNSGRLRGGADTYRAAFDKKELNQEIKQPDSDSRQSDLARSTQNTTEYDHNLKTRSSASQGESVFVAERQEENLAQTNPAKTSYVPKTKPTANLHCPKILVMGRKGSGKTSLVNALLAEDINRDRSSEAQISPTKSLQRHRVELPQARVRIELLDTPGYEDNLSNPRRKRQSQKEFAKGIALAAQEANAILLTLNVYSNDRNQDLALLQGVRDSYIKRANLKPPPVIVVLVFPAWEACLKQPEVFTAARESNARVHKATTDDEHELEAAEIKSDHLGSDVCEHPVSQAVAETRDLFGDLIDDVIPIFHDIGDDFSLESRRKSVTDNLVPSLERQLDSIQSVAKLLDYEQSLNKSKYRILFQQAKNSGKKLVSGWLEARSRRKK